MTDMEQIYKELEEILDAHVRPKLSEHQGGISIVDLRNNTLYVKLNGHCSGCPSAKYTMESLVKEEILAHTNCIEDVRLHEEVSQELYDFAKEILRKRKG